MICQRNTDDFDALKATVASLLGKSFEFERRIYAVEVGVKRIEDAVRTLEAREELRYQTPMSDIGVKRMEKSRTLLIIVVAIGVAAVVAACLYG